MNPSQNVDVQQFERLRLILLPILTDAAIGKFDRDAPVPSRGSHDFNEILVGVQILLEIIREQHEQLTVAEAELLNVQYQTSEILARILDRSLPYHLR